MSGCHGGESTFIGTRVWEQPKNRLTICRTVVRILRSQSVFMTTFERFLRVVGHFIASTESAVRFRGAGLL